MRSRLPLAVTHEVRDRCLCLHLQRAARATSRLFDEALRPHGVTSGQFSLLMALNRPSAPRITDLVPFLAMDRTTLTAALKPLTRRGLVAVVADESDRRNRRLVLTDAGRDCLAGALPAWRATHDVLDGRLAAERIDELRSDLHRLSQTA